MAEQSHFSFNKNEWFRQLIVEAESLVESNLDDVANMANLSALIMDRCNYHWVGFYRVMNDELILGPFQGPVACTRIAYGKGVCGTSWKDNKTLNVANVHEFPGHIACSAASNAELVIPVHKHDEVVAVLDIDSVQFNAFDQVDVEGFEAIVKLLEV